MKQSAKRNTSKSCQQANAAAFMLEGMTDTAIAQQLGVSRVTVWRWRNSPEVVARLSAERNRRMETVARRMDTLADAALDVFESVILDAKAPAIVRMKAAAEILDRVGVTAQAAREFRQQSVAAERDHADRLDDLDNPMSLASLTAGLVVPAV